MISVAIEADRALGMLRRIYGNAADPRQLLVRAGELLRDYEGRMFATAGLGQWPADDPATVRAKGSGRVLVDTGGLLNDLSGGGVDYEAESVVVRSRSVGGVMAQKGAHGPTRNPVAVPPASVRADWARDLLGVLVEGG